MTTLEYVRLQIVASLTIIIDDTS